MAEDYHADTEQPPLDAANEQAEQEELAEEELAEEELGESEPEPGSEPEAEAPAEAASDEEEPLVTPGMNWFVLRVASNKEDYVRETLLRKIKIEGFTHLVNRILVPTEKQKSIKGGKQKIVLKKLYPGYVFVEMKLEPDGRIPQDVFFLIKETTGVGDFIGAEGKPSPMSLPEIEKVVEAAKPPDEKETTFEMQFQKGDPVRIKEGAFENYEGTVDELLPDQGKLRVIMMIFGRAAPIEMEYWKVEKVGEEE